MKNIGFLVFDDMELLDLAGPYEVFSAVLQLYHQPFNVFTIGKRNTTIRSINGLRMIPDHSFSDNVKIDILGIPGGFGVRVLLLDSIVLDWIRQIFEEADIIFSVCSGALLLAELGLLDDKEFTTHHSVVNDVRKIAPKAVYKEGKRYIDNGNILTAGGISAGMDIAFYLLSKLYGREMAERIQVYMEYGHWEKIKEI